jgi:hypothetical protein
VAFILWGEHPIAEIFARHASDGSGHFRPCLEPGGNCWFAALILDRAVIAASSKKIEHFNAAIALGLTYYGFCKIHGAMRMTPAQAAGVENSQCALQD